MKIIQKLGKTKTVPLVILVNSKTKTKILRQINFKKKRYVASFTVLNRRYVVRFTVLNRKYAH